MYRSNSVSPSGLLQQQPQRYSDRHQQQSSGSAEFQPRGWYAALQRRRIEHSVQLVESQQMPTEKENSDRHLHED